MKRGEIKWKLWKKKKKRVYQNQEKNESPFELRVSPCSGFRFK